jgi:hypothetical protein
MLMLDVIGASWKQPILEIGRIQFDGPGLDANLSKAHFDMSKMSRIYEFGGKPLCHEICYSIRPQNVMWL